MLYETHTLRQPGISKNFSIKNHIITSQVLKGNPLGDNPVKHNFVLEPSSVKGELPLVVHLSGYFGNGPEAFSQKAMETNLPQNIIRLTQLKKIPQAIHVFVDAMTSVGGSQFINSEACGRYSDYIQKELAPTLLEEFNIKKDAKFHCVMGASSGGYGALHHVSVDESVFGVAIAIAPDSFFEASLLPDIYKLSPYMKEYSDLKKVLKAVSDGSIKKKKNFFSLINALAMTLCYSKLGNKNQILFPIDDKTGELEQKRWQTILAHDPVRFLPKRKKSLKNKRIYLDVGIYDDFHLYFGARQIREILKQARVRHTYNEFPGTHFGLGDRKSKALGWLKDIW